MKKMVFDDYLSSRMIPAVRGSEFAIGQLTSGHMTPLRFQKNFTVENVDITDYKHEPLAFVKFRFDTVKEAEFMADFVNDHFYEHVTFEYED